MRYDIGKREREEGRREEGRRGEDRGKRTGKGEDGKRKDNIRREEGRVQREGESSSFRRLGLEVGVRRRRGRKTERGERRGRR